VRRVRIGNRVGREAGEKEGRIGRGQEEDIRKM
jgi:hypothetical protein